MAKPNVKAILLAAERHGDVGDPDHEIGDLQDALLIAWKTMNAEQKKQAWDEYWKDHETWLDSCCRRCK
jgi:hypothetical protein